VLRLAVLFGVLLVGVAGCKRKQVDLPPSTPPVIPVSQIVERDVTDYSDYTGHTEAVQSVSVRARVTGFIIKSPFEEGADVQEGDLLFEIDPRPYQAQVDQAQSQVVLNQASYNLAKTVYDRDNSPRAAGVISQLQIDQDKAAVDEADARIKSSLAMLDNAKLNLSYTQVRAPISGQVGRYNLTQGNLITQDQTLLTTIIALDYMYAQFEIEDRAYQRVKRALDKSNIPPPIPQPVTRAFMAVTGGLGWRIGSTTMQRSNFPVLLATEGEEGFPHKGKLDYLNNQFNSSTGTVMARGLFNSAHSRTLSSLLPGAFVRVRLPLGEPHKAQLVYDSAIGSDQGLKFVYVVDDKNKVQYRRVVTRSVQDDGLREIEPYVEAKSDKDFPTGVKPGEWVVVGGLQQLRPRMEVQPDQTPMPTLTSAPPTRKKPQPPVPGETKKKA
jgi:multidrug efflux system membrane fusion protein